MRVLFAGSPPLAVPSLENVHRLHQIAGVLTNPDRPAGRSSTPVPTAVKARAQELGLPLLQPARLDAALFDTVRALACELLVVVAFGRIFPAEFLSLFPRGGLNLHPSLLPRYRGPSPIPAAILAGDRETGVTIQRLAAKMDSGDILRVQVVPLTGTEICATLTEKLGRLGAELLALALSDMEAGRAQGRPQNEAEATYCRMVRKQDGRIDWGRDAETIERMIRAYDPWPGAYTCLRGQTLHLLAGGVLPESEPGSIPRPGLVLGADNRYGILVGTGRGVLYVSRLKLQGKKALDWRSCLNGQRDLPGAVLGEDNP
jgi:methionyl-tRNA formyltransferase